MNRPLQTTIRLIKLPGHVDYQTAWRYQKVLQEHVNELKKSKTSNHNHKTIVGYLLLLQHQSIYTLGKGGDISNIKKDINGQFPHSIYRIERGGDITWHGPGQLTIYPILDLSCFKCDLHWYLRELEQVVINTLADTSVSKKKEMNKEEEKGELYEGLKGQRSDINTGVWIGNNKISAIGITASRWITMHGCSINVDCDLTHFQHIVPCGISDSHYSVTSVLTELNNNKKTTNKLSIASTPISNSDQEVVETEPSNSTYSTSFTPPVMIHSSALMESVTEAYIRYFANQFQAEIADATVGEIDEILERYPHIKTAELTSLVI